MYGAPLYKEVQVAGQVGPEEYRLSPDGKALIVQGAEGEIYVRIRTSVLEEGFGADRVFTVGIFEAQRDASGTTEDGREWSVAKGATNAFAY